MPDRQVVSAGNKYGFLGFLDSEGILTGSTPTAPGEASATNGGMARILGIKRVGINVPEPESVIVTWDDDAFAEFQFGSTQSRRFLIDVAIQDLALMNRLQNMPTNAKAGANLGYLDLPVGAEYDVCAIFQSRAKKQRASDRGSKAWGGTIMPLGQARVLGRQEFNERTGAVYRMSLTPQLSRHHPWGVTIYNNDNVETDATMIPFDSDYPITMHRFTGALATIPVDYTPAGAAYVAVDVERVAQTVNSVSAKNVVIASTPAAGSRGVVFYQFSGE